MKKDIQTYANVATSANGIAAAIAYAAGGYALSAAGAGDGLAHLITFLNKTVTTHTGQTITFTGTDENDNPISETLTGPAGSATITTTKYFKTVTSVTASATTGADTFDIGWTAASVGAWVRPNTDVAAQINIGIGCTVVSGTPTYAIRYSYDGVAWFTHATITGKTASFDGAITIPCAAFQLIFAAAGTVSMTAVQSGVSSS